MISGTGGGPTGGGAATTSPPTGSPAGAGSNTGWPGGIGCPGGGGGGGGSALAWAATLSAPNPMTVPAIATAAILRVMSDEASRWAERPRDYPANPPDPATSIG
ncbi:hypothetical protein MAGR_55640 [Mycolicibacterium agri]|uniref:Uncharacterized protein n=1 Tax=Mycolicibacterium agri TaxID=36811 RepID=A0A7I9W8T8_MYCAG|nr:hypothetical protein MAGR_55640 [Mycolicibacterium agri]